MGYNRKIDYSIPLYFQPKKNQKKYIMKATIAFRTVDLSCFRFKKAKSCTTAEKTVKRNCERRTPLNRYFTRKKKKNKTNLVKQFLRSYISEQQTRYKIPKM